jgi:hypothetical protein
MWRRILSITLPGLIIGSAIGTYASWITRHIAVIANPDAPMGAQLVIDVASLPISLLTGPTVYRLSSAIGRPALWRVMDYSQVILNSMLLSAVGISMGRRLIRQRRK